jgi:hypothetical protein
VAVVLEITPLAAFATSAVGAAEPAVRGAAGDLTGETATDRAKSDRYARRQIQIS